MSITTRISCDCCTKPTLYNAPHIAVEMKPLYPGGRRDKHFCDTTCLGQYLTGLKTAFEKHSEAYQEFRRTRR